MPREGFLTYCERIYLNPVSGLGPDHANLLPAKLYQLKLPSLEQTAEAAARAAAGPSAMPANLPPPLPLATFRDDDAKKTMRFFHIIKTGGESLELHLASQPSPSLNYSHCRAAGMASGWTAELSEVAHPGCAAAAAGVSAVLCAANCECCAHDTKVEGGFHGTLIRSPRAHMLSLFSHCHTAHTSNTWSRLADDVPQYLAEVILRSTEWTCGSYCGNSFAQEWGLALREGLRKGDNQTLRVLPLQNTQAHAMTCSTKPSGDDSVGGRPSLRRSLGQHFRLLDPQRSTDSLQPDVNAALASVRNFEWVGLTDLFDHSLCLLHFQANGSLPNGCSCNSPAKKVSLGLPRFNHGVVRRDPSGLSPDVLALIDEHTTADAQLFAEALRLLLGRLRTVEEATGEPLLECIDWRKLWRASQHIPGLWDGPNALHAVGSSWGSS